MKRSFPLLALVIISGQALAGDSTGAAFLGVPMSVRQAGMGEVSLGGNDVMRAWSNPALLADQASKYELALAGSQMFGEQKSAGLGFGQSFGPAWTGGAYAGTSGVSAREINADGAETSETLSHEVITGGLVFAWRGESLRFGIAGKGVSETVAKNSASTVLGALGLAWRLGGVLVGASARNYGGELAFSDSAKVKPPTEMRAGAAWDLDYLVLAGEFVKPALMAGTAGAGIEWRPARVLALRAGVLKGLGKDSASPGISAGLTGAFRGISLDYAVATHEIGTTNRISLGCEFGGRRGPAGIENMGMALPPMIKTALPISSTMSAPPAMDIKDGMAPPRPRPAGVPKKKKPFKMKELVPAR